MTKTKFCDDFFPSEVNFDFFEVDYNYINIIYLKRPKSKLLYSIIKNKSGEYEVVLFAAQFKVFYLL